MGCLHDRNKNEMEPLNRATVKGTMPRPFGDGPSWKEPERKVFLTAVIGKALEAANCTSQIFQLSLEPVTASPLG